MNWLIKRLREPSTWRGLIWLATAFGVTLRPEVWEQITAVGMAVAGLIGVLTSEPQKLPPIELVGQALSPATPGQDRNSPGDPESASTDFAADYRAAPERLHDPGLAVPNRSDPQLARPARRNQYDKDSSPGWNG